MNHYAIEDKIKFPYSIFHKMMFHVVLLIFLVVSINTFLSVKTETEVIRKGLIQKGKNLAMYMAVSTESAFWSLNWIFVERLLQKSGQHEQSDQSVQSEQRELIFAKVVKPNREVYLANDKKYYGEIIDASVLLNKETILEDYHFSVNGQKGVLLSYPFFIEKERWYVLLGLSMQPIEAIANDLILRNMISGSGILLLALIASFFLSKTISKPIITLSNATKNVKDGDWNCNVTIQSNDEVGMLSHSFNTMIKHLKKMEEAQRQAHLMLEHQVDVRTKALQGQVKKRAEAEAELRHTYEVLKNTQAQLVQTGKLASIGELAAGVAHELNQPLMVIRGNIQLICRNLRKNRLSPDQLIEQLEPVERNTKRMTNIINHLRTFSRQSNSEFQSVDINKIIDDSFLMLGEQLRIRNIDMRQNLDAGLPKVKGDANQFEQVILNLITNARDAVTAIADLEENKIDDEFKGMVEIITRTAKPVTNLKENENCNQHSRNCVEILIKDNGGGISPKDIEKIFDPFFTTKEVGKGTGLGLSISYGIIKDHQGVIDVAETGMEGTTIRIRLPIYDL